jgi:AICAR transformylase/IMP cyclohydrolase PurH
MGPHIYGKLQFETVNPEILDGRMTYVNPAITGGLLMSPQILNNINNNNNLIKYNHSGV